MKQQDSPSRFMLFLFVTPFVTSIYAVRHALFSSRYRRSTRMNRRPHRHVRYMARGAENRCSERHAIRDPANSADSCAAGTVRGVCAAECSRSRRRQPKCCRHEQARCFARRNNAPRHGSADLRRCGLPQRKCAIFSMFAAGGSATDRRRRHRDV